MPSLANTRGRGGRATALRIAASPTADLKHLLRDRWVLSRLALGLLTVIALTACVQSWKHPFPFRLNQRPADGVAAVISFQRVNPERTARDRDRAAEQVLPVFNLNPQPLTRAPQELRNGLTTFLTAESINRLPVETRRAFGLNADAGPPISTGLVLPDRNELFQKLKQLAADESQLRDVVADFGRFLQPLEKKGLVLPDQVAAINSPAGQITILSTDGTSTVANLSDLQLPTLLSASGFLTSRWTLFPTLEPYRAELEYWLRVQSPTTLLYDPQATAAARQKAASDTPEVFDEYYAGNLLVKPGELIDERKLELLQFEYDLLDARVGTFERATRVSIVFVLML
ncbi:MAG: hypothetical protein JSS02_24355, partial [Planctomycetes bacterium]|nr:hypothetical protein [Planctomycetota bacterium]